MRFIRATFIKTSKSEKSFFNIVIEDSVWLLVRIMKMEWRTIVYLH